VSSERTALLLHASCEVREKTIVGRSYYGANYSYTFDSNTGVTVCDQETDGDGAYSQYGRANGQYNTVSDANGIQPGCSSGTHGQGISQITYFRTCEDHAFASDPCGVHVTVAAEGRMSPASGVAPEACDRTEPILSLHRVRLEVPGRALVAEANLHVHHRGSGGPPGTCPRSRLIRLVCSSSSIRR